MKKKKILMVFGTRPEAIKMAPLYFALRQHSDSLDVAICLTAQHRQMLDQVMDFFGMEAAYDLNLMKPNQTLYGLTSAILEGMQPVLAEFRPDFVLVHGDTSTSMAAALAAFYAGTKVGHVEAGLRTFNKWAPFPEEMNRSLTGRLADIHFAPSAQAAANLTREGVNIRDVLVTGNTVIDALQQGLQLIAQQEPPAVMALKSQLSLQNPMILVTGHRRENFGDGFIKICQALRTIAETEMVDIVYPVHLNPNVQQPVYELLSGLSNVHLIEPQPYEAFIWLMSQSRLIITDSGGVQEEAPSLGKPVLVMRDTTERPEAVAEGTVILVGTDAAKIVSETHSLLHNTARYKAMAARHNPYGDGQACSRIAQWLLQQLLTT